MYRVLKTSCGLAPSTTSNPNKPGRDDPPGIFSPSRTSLSDRFSCRFFLRLFSLISLSRPEPLGRLEMPEKQHHRLAESTGVVPIGKAAEKTYRSVTRTCTYGDRTVTVVLLRTYVGVYFVFRKFFTSALGLEIRNRIFFRSSTVRKRTLLAFRIDRRSWKYSVLSLDAKRMIKKS